MKKIFAALLALILASNIVLIYFSAENSRIMKRLLESGASQTETDLNTDLQQSDLPSESGSGSAESSAPGEFIHVSEDKYLDPPNDWIFEFTISNTTGKPLFIKSLDIIDNESDNYAFDENNRPELLEDIMGPEFRTEPLAPGDTLHWNDAHPGEMLTSRTYRFVFADADGNEYYAIFDYNLIMEFANSAKDYSSDNGKDLATVFHDASFSEEVFEGVFWVPANTLGKSRYSNAEISNMISVSPEVKQEKISTLYEALQLYQIGGFHAADDNIRITENGINWEHHKPGYYAVVTNCGCCATDSNWLKYILKDDYDEAGFIATSQRDGSGHIYNYIKDGDWYYFIDLTHYRTDWVATAPESGNLDEYYNSDFILGNIHRTKSVENFVAYVQKAFSDPPGLMFKYTAENCLAIDSVSGQNGVTIVYGNKPDTEVEVIFDDQSDSLYYRFQNAPSKVPDWS